MNESPIISTTIDNVYISVLIRQIMKTEKIPNIDSSQYINTSWGEQLILL